MPNLFVSQQNGNDSNNGLTPATAYATITKASQVAVASAGVDTFVYIGPGIYRESFVPTNNGLSATERIIYQGDPNCVHLTGDKPGRVRITRCNTAELPQTGRVLDWTGKTNVELTDCDVDGSSNDYALYNVAVARRVNATSKDGIFGGVNYNCTSIGGSRGFDGGTNYNCTSIGGGNGFQFGTNYNCTSIGGINGFSGSTSYNCTSIGGSNGFSSSTNYNCTSIGGSNGFSSGTNYNCTSIGGRNGFNSGMNRNCRNVYCITGDQTAGQHVAFDLLKILPAVLDTYGMMKGAHPHSTQLTTTTSYNLTGERLYAFTPTAAEVGKSIGAQMYVHSRPLSGNVTVELQKNISGTWTTQRSRTLACTALLAAEWNIWDWDTGDGDDILTAVANVWRFKVTGDANGASTVLGGSASALAVIGHVYYSHVPESDPLGQRRDYGMPTAYAADVPVVELDDVVYQTLGPSIRFTGHGEKVLKLPVQAGVAVTVQYQARHNDAPAARKPQLRLRGLGIVEQTATHTGTADTWQALSVTATPGVNGLLEVVLASRSPSHKAWFSDPSVT